MDREWVKNPNRVSPQYVAGIEEFITIAKESLNSAGLTLCPCLNCANRRLQSIDVIRAHLIKKGIDNSYTRWVYHGEEESEEEEGVGNEEFFNEQFDGLGEGLHDAAGVDLFNIGPTSDFVGNERPAIEEARYEKLYEALNNPVYNGCENFSTLTFVVKLMNIKVMNKWSDNSFEMLLKLIHEVLPKGNNCPENYYDTRRLLCDLGLGYEHIDVCLYDCAIFYGEHSNATICPVCKYSRYVRNKIPHKRLRYFPVTPRLKRLYSSRHTARDMRWHKEIRAEEPGVLRHPADGKAWKHFDELYPDFAADSRNVRLGLASDGFNPFSNMSTTHSIWPVILMPYNMPPWRSMHKSNYLLTLLIPGPKSPGKDFDVFLRPLVDELKVLWCNGVQAYDEYSRSSFTLRATVMWTISDFPAYAYLSGWSTMGKLLEEVPICTPGKAPNNDDRKRKRGVDELNWSKKSILFELPYWSKLLMRHNLDVMHIEKNVCDNIVGTLLNDPMKSKDTVKARLDLEDLNIRKELWLKERNGKFEKPHANYTLSKSDCEGFCDFIKSVRLPDGYASNISRCVTDSHTLGGMKTHDCHVLLQKILPVAILPYLDKKIRATLIEFCQFFQKLSAKTLYVNKLENMKTGIVIILCKLEKIFPLSFFTIMVHLCVHLPEQALWGGPVSSRWMFGIERRMGTYKGYVRNFSRPDGSITEAYVVDEAVTFLSRYLHNIETRFTRLERNWDVPCTQHKMELFNNKIRTMGASKFGKLGVFDHVVQWYLLNNCGDELDGYINEHKEVLRLRNVREEDFEVVQKHEFPSWFKNKMANLRVNGDPKATDYLYSLSQYADDRYTIWHSCIVNGVRFRCKERDDKFKTQCSGVCTEGDYESSDFTYYGVLLEILELDFIYQRTVFMFRCKWYNTDPKGKRIVVNNNLTSLDITSNWYAEDPFILATQAQQVFYLNDRSRGKNWMVVQKVNHRNIYDIIEHDDDEERVNDDIFQEEESSELPHFQPTEEVVDTSLLVRQNEEPISFPHELVVKLRSEQTFLNDREHNLEDIEDYDDDGRFFITDEVTLESETDDDSDDPDLDDNDDDDA
ncbi:uncharacterized protein LOC127794290 [Diospyros lotus]|uniref:uncharacterized protein LOC127794290 n=1 Tax=Diospyros lotus TaxID=55363 RepID=UPI0022520174|nr:uncharacterized protein LOC127794290 [Diospyros lotus]